MKNQLVGDVNLSQPGAQFKEQGNINIVEAPLNGNFNDIFTTMDLDYAHFCEFTNQYPYIVDTDLHEIEVASGPSNSVVLFDDFRIRSYDSTEDAGIVANTKNAIITDFLPWIYAVDSSGDRSYAYEIRLSRKNPNYTPAAWLSPPAGYGYTEVQTWSGGTSPVSTDNTLYKLELQASVSITIRAFGLMYNYNLLE